ncbi:hypothetical protein F5880DRAFT_894413 [Lentinula raphanica]|nr:hypothetical protein F5880DRAFT_894413 [Lentinula raphanica]
MRMQSNKLRPSLNSQAEIDKLRKANAEAHVSSEALSVKLERTTLQLDGERSKIADLERINSELKRSNDELKRQVAKWQSLESKGDSEMEAERKKRVELEVQLQAVQNQLNKREQEFVKAEKKTEKAKQVLDDWKVHAEDLQAQLDELQKKYAAAEKSNGQLLTKVQSLKKVRNTTKSPQKSPLESEEEVAHAVSQAAPSSPAPVPASRTSQREAASKASSSQSSSRQTSKGTAARASRSPTVDADAPARTARAKGKGKAVVAERDSDAEAESAQPQKKTRKPRYGPKSKQAPATDDSEVEIISQEDFSVGKKRQAKRKASPLPVVDEEGDEEERSNSRDSPAPAKRRKRNDDPPVQRPPATKKRAGKNAPPSFAESTASTVTVDPEPAGSTSQKNGTTKKRKINLFPSAGKMDFANLDFGSQGSGIPSILSPLKPEQAVPARSTSFLSLLKR